jgi:hypothetical protein
MFGCLNILVVIKQFEMSECPQSMASCSSIKVELRCFYVDVSCTSYRVKRQSLALKIILQFI